LFKKKAAVDMEKRYASANPNKQMYEMYNLSMRQSTGGGIGNQSA